MLSGKVDIDSVILIFFLHSFVVMKKNPYEDGVTFGSIIDE